MREECDEDSVMDIIFQYNALISFFLHIPFPEQLDEDAWFDKAAQVRWLEDAKILPVKFERHAAKSNKPGR